MPYANWILLPNIWLRWINAIYNGHTHGPCVQQATSGEFLSGAAEFPPSSKLGFFTASSIGGAAQVQDLNSM